VEQRSPTGYKGRGNEGLTKKMTSDPNSPYALKSVDEIDRRLKLLALPHVSPLIEYIQHATAKIGGGYEIPYFDPCDGGINASVLILLEAPGRKAVGSNFISRNNPDPSARNMCRFLAEAGLSRNNTVLWNIVPWYLGTASKIRAVKKSDIEKALPFVVELISLLPDLKAIILVGRKAQSAKPRLVPITDAEFFECPHPSLQALNRNPKYRTEMLNTFVKVSEFLRERT
jgi:uracil-DNA glycosylase